MENWGFSAETVCSKARIFIAKKISVVVNDEERVELFKRSHTMTKRALIYKAQQTTPQSRKVILTILIVVPKRQPLTQSIWWCENVCILSSLM